MASPPESKVYNFQLHRYTLWTVGCGLLLVGGVTFFAGSLVGAWWISRPPAAATVAENGTTSTIDPAASADPSATDPASAEATASDRSTAGSLVRGPTATAPALTAPALRGPTVSRSGISGPRVTGPRAAGPRVQGPRANVPTSSTPTVGGGRVGGGRITGSSGASANGASANDTSASSTSASDPATTGTSATGGAPSSRSSPNVMPQMTETAAAVEDLAINLPPPGPAYQYAVQVGLFTDKDEAKLFVDSLTEDGYEPFIRLIRSDQRQLIVRSVCLGPWPSRQEAEEAAIHFRTEMRLGAAVVRQPAEPSPPPTDPL